MDKTAQKFLESNEEGGKITALRNQQQDPHKVAQATAAMREKQFIHTAGGFCEELIDFFRDRHEQIGSTDDEAVFALALMTINLRESFGSPQASDDPKTFDREVALKHFDAVCAKAQEYYNENKDKD